MGEQVLKLKAKSDATWLVHKLEMKFVLLLTIKELGRQGNTELNPTLLSLNYIQSKYIWYPLFTELPLVLLPS